MTSPSSGHKDAVASRPLSIFDVSARALVCNLCGAQKAEDVTNPGDERTVRCRGRWNGGPCPNISREGRIGRFGFRIDEDRARPVNWKSNAELLGGEKFQRMIHKPKPHLIMREKTKPAGVTPNKAGTYLSVAADASPNPRAENAAARGNEPGHSGPFKPVGDTMEGKAKKRQRSGGRKADYDAIKRIAIGARLKEARDDLQLSQRLMAEKAGISQRVMSLMEAGDIAMKHNVKAICKAYGIRENWLIDGVGPHFLLEWDPRGGTVHPTPPSQDGDPGPNPAPPDPRDVIDGPLADRPSHMEGIRAMPTYDEPTCVWCGCTEGNACEGNCEWILLNSETNRGLCSQCVPIPFHRRDLEDLTATRDHLKREIGKFAAIVSSLANTIAESVRG